MTTSVISEKKSGYIAFHSGIMFQNKYNCIIFNKFAAQAQGEVEVYLATNAEGRAYREMR